MDAASTPPASHVAATRRCQTFEHFATTTMSNGGCTDSNSAVSSTGRNRHSLIKRNANDQSRDGSTVAINKKQKPDLFQPVASPRDLPLPLSSLPTGLASIVPLQGTRSHEAPATTALTRADQMEGEDRTSREIAAKQMLNPTGARESGHPTASLGPFTNNMSQQHEHGPVESRFEPQQLQGRAQQPEGPKDVKFCTVTAGGSLLTQASVGVDTMAQLGNSGRSRSTLLSHMSDDSLMRELLRRSQNRVATAPLEVLANHVHRQAMLDSGRASVSVPHNGNPSYPWNLMPALPPGVASMSAAPSEYPRVDFNICEPNLLGSYGPSHVGNRWVFESSPIPALNDQTREARPSHITGVSNETLRHQTLPSRVQQPMQQPLSASLSSALIGQRPPFWASSPDQPGLVHLSNPSHGMTASMSQQQLMAQYMRGQIRHGLPFLSLQQKAVRDAAMPQLHNRLSQTTERKPKMQSSTVANTVESEKSSLAAGQLTSSLLSAIPMFVAGDVERLSEYQVLVRRQIEYFVSQQDDAEYSVQGRKKQTRLGQVGIRCRHCSHLPHRLRGRGAGYYPTKLTGVYQAGQNMATNHLLVHCNSIPLEIREALRSLRGAGRQDLSMGGGGKQYWADACAEIGMVEDENDGGLRFRSDKLPRTMSLQSDEVCFDTSKHR